jgi:hypothetical protein
MVMQRKVVAFASRETSFYSKGLLLVRGRLVGLISMISCKLFVLKIENINHVSELPEFGLLVQDIPALPANAQ